jgi:ABC-2 type transport system ATP-binding protein
VQIIQQICGAKIRLQAVEFYMEITLTNAGKRFRFDWIFRGLNHMLLPGGRTALLGPNGSGKSTLMKVLSGHLTLSKGAISFKHEDKILAPEDVYQHIGYAAPYIELIEEFTLAEAIQFHHRLKPLQAGLTTASMMDLLELSKNRDKEIRFFSSGMKQRVKLALAICSDCPVVLLDEPSTNLDVNAIAWSHRLLDQYSNNRLIVIATNDPADLELCDKQVDIMGWKK